MMTEWYVGQRVAIRSGFGGERIEPATVERLTQRYVVVNDDHYRRDGGDLRGASGYNKPRIVPWNNEVETEYETRRVRRRIKNHLNRIDVRLKDMRLDELRRVDAALAGLFEEE